MLDGVTVAMSVMAAAFPVFLFALVPGKAAWTGAGGGTKWHRWTGVLGRSRCPWR